MPKKQDEQEQGEALIVPPQKKEDKPMTFAEAGIDGPPDEVVTWAVEAPAEVVYYYLPDENPNGLKFAGVPLRDLTARDVDRLPEWKKRQLKKAPFYSDTPPGETKGGSK